MGTWALVVSWDPPRPLVGAGNCGRPPSPFPGDMGDQSSSYPEDWDMLALTRSSPRLPAPCSAPGSCSCHTALVMPRHSSVAVTLQRPCNDSDLKTGCPSQRTSKCSQGARRRLGVGVGSDDPQVPLPILAAGGEGLSSQLFSRKHSPWCSFRNYQRLSKEVVLISLCYGQECC